MEAKDLMIGDWVYRPACYDQVKEIRYTGVIGIDGMRGLITFSELEPIPLTQEILEKNGFIKDANKDDRLVDMYNLFVPTGFEKGSFTIQVGLYREPICGVSTLVKCWGWIPPYNGGLNDIHLCNANYVHQLQHALRLCGIDKDIVL